MALQQKSGERRKSGLFIVEGVRELQHCINAQFAVETIYHCPQLCPALSTMLPAELQDCVIEVSPAVYEKIAYRGTTEGVLATVRSRSLTLDDIVPADDHAPLYIILESVEKPGNLGAVLRTADAAQADAVIVCDPLTDLYNPNLIRSAIGAVFTVPTVACTSEECIAWLKAHGIKILTAQLQDSVLYYDSDMTLPTAIVMGTEATGLTDQWRQAADTHIRIPMLGKLDSLNVSVSAAILTFEAVRQRQISEKF